MSGTFGLTVRVVREPAADLIPRFDGTTLRLTSKTAQDAPAGGGLVVGPVLVDLGRDGRLVGVTVLEERRFWQKGTVAWALPTRATPHRLDVVDAGSGGAADEASRDPGGAAEPLSRGPGVAAEPLSRGPGVALAVSAELRWDAARRLCGLILGPAREPAVFALGPRAYAVVEDDVLVALLADLRGFDRAAG